MPSNEDNGKELSDLYVLQSSASGSNCKAVAGDFTLHLRALVFFFFTYRSSATSKYSCQHVKTRSRCPLHAVLFPVNEDAKL
ncbi:hypothetical protein Hypma_014872 [Hypsizygus marmoreus]|uniref:Uncharacterized protein n=1 Tax=Hypsizygus marmoreus TaxID=39966 RepID=A0A369K8U4_HYPMA|nr:hypothetical protein Hypma_014872 [Hypsizygus marmoreus]